LEGGRSLESSAASVVEGEGEVNPEKALNPGGVGVEDPEPEPEPIVPSLVFSFSFSFSLAAAEAEAVEPNPNPTEFPNVPALAAPKFANADVDVNGFVGAVEVGKENGMGATGGPKRDDVVVVVGGFSFSFLSSFSLVVVSLGVSFSFSFSFSVSISLSFSLSFSFSGWGGFVPNKLPLPLPNADADPNTLPLPNVDTDPNGLPVGLSVVEGGEKKSGTLGVVVNWKEDEVGAGGSCLGGGVAVVDGEGAGAEEEALNSLST
jgi:hypothetical protein